MLSRRRFFACTTAGAAAAFAAPARMSSKERVDRALRGQEVDRPPFTFWHHFGLQELPGERHAKATLEFHRKFRTDLVKVMSDYSYPKPEKGKWYEMKVLGNPFPEQLDALERIREGLGGKVYFLETIFNPWNQATKVSSKEDVMKLKRENPKALLEALQAIAESQANHAKRAVAAGASGIFLAIDNAQDGVLSQQDYTKFSEPFDKLILDAVSGLPLNTMHLHGDKVYLDRFLGAGWRASVINYSNFGTGVGLAEIRKKYSGMIMGGLDERSFRTLDAKQLQQQSESARAAAGTKFILAPGCSVPDDSKDAELMRLPALLGE
jgi:uroporphyrinogen decarboxylase